VEIDLRTYSVACLATFSTFVRLIKAGRLADLHLRRQISRDFHASANFDNDRDIPSHRFDSLSFSPRGASGSHWTKVASLARCVTSFEIAELHAEPDAPIPQTAQLLNHDRATARFAVGPTRDT
jgi:hypothetical protein